jgi:hypothetical protein
MSEPLTRNDVADMLETMLDAEIRAVRSLRDDRIPRRPPTAHRRKSNTTVVEDILRAAGAPLHVSEIIARAQRDHDRILKRESIVSALTKKVLDGRVFRRTGPNVFALLTGSEKNGEDRP